MSDLKRGSQQGGGRSSGQDPSGGQPKENNEGAEFGTKERATRGTNRDFDESGESINQGHGHTADDRGNPTGQEG